MKKIRVFIVYNINKNTFNVNTNAKNPKEIVNNFLRSQLGKGEDNTEPAKLDVYKIDLILDLNEDVFNCEHNCINLGLRDGILMHYVKSVYD